MAAKNGHLNAVKFLVEELKADIEQVMVVAYSDEEKG